jgi:tRNA1(Val) A37 N6-methylase TrmN6
LFFATLNCEKGKREFRKESDHQNVTYLMRYKSYFKNPELFLEIMESKVPFMNGGLFDCLDKVHPDLRGKFGGDIIIYQDGFSDKNTNVVSVPDYLFFDRDELVDLSKAYGQPKYKNVNTKGLLKILESYKFTITENTPIEEDVALDPELLGRVFENLLASYNPETKTTARKQTGSFYTPREIVNYMVDESLIAYLKNAVPEKYWDLSENELDDRLHQLMSFDNQVLFDGNHELKKQIIKAIDNCKILDPACGSGAFPMGVLQKMVHVLHKIDPKNEEWQQRQLDRIDEAVESLEEIQDAEYRNRAIKELKEQKKDIKRAFENNELDYGRKLYLIENCIYGVDIQSIAVQISKLRFFISLIVDQNIDYEQENFGIRPLPNLETKFVAANTLIGTAKPESQLSFFDNEQVKELEQKIKSLNKKLFSIKSPSRKREIREEMKAIRNQMAEILEDDGLDNKTARTLAKWDPFDQNASSPFFDPEWMFDIQNGFDIVIGNPPYVLLQERIKNEIDLVFIRKSFRVASYKVDMYHLFYEKGINLLSNNGTLSYITPTNFLLNNYTSELRKILLENNLSSVLILKNNVFEASVDTSVFNLIKNGNAVSDYVKFIDGFIDKENLKLSQKSNIKRSIFKKDDFVINPEFDVVTLELLNKLEKEKKIGDIATVNFGMQLRNRSHFPDDVLQIIDKTNLSVYHKECYTGRDIKEFQVLFENRYCYFNREAQSGGCWDEKVHFAKNKLLIPQVGKFPVAGIDLLGFPVLNTAFMIVPINKNSSYSLQAIINSKITRYYWTKKFYDQRQTFPKIKGTYLKEIPIPDDFNNETISLISKVISFNVRFRNSVLRDILEGVIIELYIKDHMKERGIDVLEFVEQDIAYIMHGREFDNLDDTEKEQVIEQLHSTWTDPNNEVVKRMSMFKEKSPEILKPILES